MKNRKQKAPSKGQQKKQLPQEEEFDLVELLHRLREGSESDRKSAVEDLLKFDFPAALKEIVGYILSAFGITNIGLLNDSEYLLEKKEEALRSLSSKENIDPGSEKKDQLLDIVALVKALLNFYLSNIQGNRKSPFGEAWTIMLDEILDWLYHLSDVHIESLRCEAVAFSLNVLKEVIKSAQLINDFKCAENLEAQVSKYMIRRLNDFSDSVKIDILNFMETLFAESKSVLKSAGRRDTKSLVTSLLRRLNDPDSKVKQKSSQMLQCILMDEQNQADEVVCDVVREYKEYVLKAVLSSSQKDVEVIFQLVKCLHENGRILSQVDLNKYFLLIFHFNKAIAQKAASLLVECTGYKHMSQDGFDEANFINFIVILGSLVEIQQRKDPEADFASIAEKIADVVDAGKIKGGIFKLLRYFLAKENLELRNERLKQHLLEFLIGYSRYRKLKKEEFLEQELNDYFFEISKFCEKSENNLLAPFLNLFLQEVVIDGSRDFEDKARRLNEILRVAKSEKIIKLILTFFHVNKGSSRIIQDLLTQNYEMYQFQLSKTSLAINLQEDDRLLLFKINLIVRSFLIEKDIANDFWPINTILENFSSDKYTYEPYQIIRCCLNFKLSCYKAVYYRFFQSPNNIETAKRNNDNARADLILLLETFMEYKSNNFSIHHKEKLKIRLEAFCLLLDLYQLVSSDVVWNLHFICYIPTVDNTHCLVKFIMNSLESYDKDFGNFLGSEQKVLLRRSRENSPKSTTRFEEEAPNSDKKDPQVSVENFSTIRFICIRTFEFIQKCSKSFGRRIGHELIALFYRCNSSEKFLENYIQTFLKKILLKDIEDIESIMFWNYLYRTVLFAGILVDKLSDLAKLFLKVYVQVMGSRQNNEEIKTKLQQNFLACLSKLFVDAFAKKEHWNAITVISNAFISKKNFSQQEEKLKAFLWKVYSMKKDIQNSAFENELSLKIEALEAQIMKVIGLQRKEPTERADDRHTEIRIEEDFDINQRDNKLAKTKKGNPVLDEKVEKHGHANQLRLKPTATSNKERPTNKRGGKDKKKVKKDSAPSLDDSGYKVKRLKKK
jgi:hypothetical protein